MSLTESIPFPTTAAAAPRRDITLVQANAMMLLAAMAWGMGNVSQKLILDHLDPFAANGVTSLLGAAALIPFVWREGRQMRGGAGAAPPCRHSWVLLGYVTATFTVAATLMQIGYGHTTVTNGGFLVNAAAVITPVLGWLLYAQRPQLLIWPASLCALLGVFLMGGGALSALAYGDGIVLISAAFFALWTLLVGQYVAHHRRPMFMAMAQLLVCGLACVAVGAVIHGLPSATALLAAWPEIVVLGLVSKGLAYTLMAKAQERIPPTAAAVLVSAEAVFGALAAMLALAETPGALRLVGGGLILCAVALAAHSPAAPDPRPHRARVHSRAG